MPEIGLDRRGVHLCGRLSRRRPFRREELRFYFNDPDLQRLAPGFRRLRMHVTAAGYGALQRGKCRTINLDTIVAVLGVSSLEGTAYRFFDSVQIAIPPATRQTWLAAAAPAINAPRPHREHSSQAIGHCPPCRLC